MLQIKADNMVVFIAKEREEITSLWDVLFYSEGERRRFSLFDSGIWPLHAFVTSKEIQYLT